MVKIVPQTASGYDLESPAGDAHPLSTIGQINKFIDSNNIIKLIIS
jgi:hypothetical protein